MKRDKAKLVMVLWWDTYGCDQTWSTMAEVEEVRPSKSYSVGWLIMDEKDFITLSATLNKKYRSRNAEVFGEVICIHRRAIDSIRELDFKPELEAKTKEEAMK